MSPIQDSSRMPYELSAEEAQLFVAPLTIGYEKKPRSRKWLKRWVLANAELIEFDNISVIVKGLRYPLSLQAQMRKALPDDLEGMMPRFIGDFNVRDTTFIVVENPQGIPPEKQEQIPIAIEALLKLDALFRFHWGEKPIPDGVSKTEISIEPLKRIAKRIPENARTIEEIIWRIKEIPFSVLEKYPCGLMHGDPGMDNARFSDAGIVFDDGPNEVGTEIVDVAYLVQSAREFFENFDTTPCIELLAKHYERDFEEVERDFSVADIVAQINILKWFDRCSTEILPDFQELYDHFIDERLRILDKTLDEKNSKY